MVLSGEQHTYEFDGFDTLSNLTYSAAFQSFQDTDRVIMKRRFADKIGQVETNEFNTGERSATILTNENKNYDYFVDNDTGDVSYMVSGSENGARSGGIDPGPLIRVEFSVKNAATSEYDEYEQLSLEEQFENQINCLWSDSACWRVDTASGDVVVPVDRHIWLDVPEVSINGDLIIHGTLQLVPDQSYRIAASNIFVYGRFAAGSAESPFPCALTVDIELTATMSAPPAPSDSSVPSGKRSLIVYGQLEFHGCPTTTRAKLLEPVQAGESSLTLDRNPSWDEGDRLVISSTSQNGAEAEELIVASVSGNRVELVRPVQHFHEAMVSQYVDKELHIQSQIGSLTRNIRVFGHQNQFDSDKFGGRILVTPSIKATAPKTV